MFGAERREQPNNRTASLTQNKKRKTRRRRAEVTATRERERERERERLSKRREIL